MFAYSNNGTSFRAVEPSYEAVADEVLFPDYATAEQLTAAFPGYAQAIAPQPVTTITPGEFFNRFTEAEQLAIQALLITEPVIALGMTTAQMLGYVKLTSPLVINWMASLVTANAITPDRSASILTP